MDPTYRPDSKRALTGTTSRSRLTRPVSAVSALASTRLTMRALTPLAKASVAVMAARCKGPEIPRVPAIELCRATARFQQERLPRASTFISFTPSQQ